MCVPYLCCGFVGVEAAEVRLLLLVPVDAESLVDRADDRNRIAHDVGVGDVEERVVADAVAGVHRPVEQRRQGVGPVVHDVVGVVDVGEGAGERTQEAEASTPRSSPGRDG